jgi:heme-degrading monooxygenase HmoA
MGENVKTPSPPYYAVIFSNMRTPDDEPGYQEMAGRMMELARKQPGYLGAESVRSDGFGITVSYWRDERSIADWKQQGEHLEAQNLGKRKWYAGFSLRVARVERAYEFKK